MNFLRPYILQPACEPDDYTYCQYRSAPFNNTKVGGNKFRNEKQETRAKIQEARDKKRETRSEIRETRILLRLDFFAPACRRQVSAPLREKRKKRQEIRDKSREARNKKQEKESRVIQFQRQDFPSSRIEDLISWFSALASAGPSSLLKKKFFPVFQIPYPRITTFLYLSGMENFVVSARKYRPADFKSVVGQQHITTTLQNAIKNKHLAQAFLFCGPRGVGKTTCARILAKTINCESITKDFEACGTCDACVSFQNNASFNVYELDAASNNSVDDIRNLVEQVRYAPQKGEYKVYIIDEVHMLSTAAFNAFLKTLEEPPKYAIFILATTEKHKIIPTILSRCQIFDFNRIQIKHIAEHLKYIAGKEEVDYEEEALRLIATKADGALRDALSIFDLIVTYSAGKKVTYQETIANLNILDYDYYFKVVDALLEENISTTLLLFDEILKKGFDGHNFIVGLSEHLRDLLVVKDEATVELLQVSESAKDRYLEQTARASVSFLLSSLNLANQCDIHYKTSKNQRLHVELTLMKVAKLSQAFRLATLASVDAKKKA